MTDKSKDPINIVIEAVPKDTPQKKLAKQHIQRIHKGGIHVYSSSFTREGEFYDISHAAFLLKLLELYKPIRTGKIQIGDISGRTFERALVERDGVTKADLEKIGHLLIDRFFGEATLMLGATKQDFFEVLMDQATKKWIDMPKMEAWPEYERVPIHAICAGLLHDYEAGILEPAIRDVLTPLFAKQRFRFPEQWFCGQALSWLLKTCRGELTQETVANQMNSYFEGIRTLRRWENGETYPKISDVLPFAKAIHGEDDQKRIQLEGWLKVACIIDQWFLNHHVHRLKDTPYEPLSQDHLDGLFNHFRRTMMQLTLCTKDQRKQCIDTMKAGKSGPPHDVIKQGDTYLKFIRAMIKAGVCDDQPWQACNISQDHEAK